METPRSTPSAEKGPDITSASGLKNHDRDEQEYADKTAPTPNPNPNAHITGLDVNSTLIQLGRCSIFIHNPRGI
jgi:hypothetical protein